MRDKIIPIAKPVLGPEEIEAVASVLGAGDIAQGKVVEEFEEAFARFIGTNYAIATNSGTAALHIALLAHGIGLGDEVITTPFTFVATANSVLFAGASPIFADISEEDYNIDPDSILEKITPRSKAMIPVHLYGQPCNMDRIATIAGERGLVVIEDACQAHGAKYQGRKVGVFSTACFSFYPTKNMTTGEGGMITTNDPKIAEKAKMLRSHGQRERYRHDLLGYNYRMTNLAAAIGVCQLKKLEYFNEKRIENAQSLSKKLLTVGGLLLPSVKPGNRHVFQQFTVRVTADFGRSREELRECLREQGVGAEVYYPTPIHQQPLYRKLGYRDHLPVAEKAASEVLSLPVHPSLTDQDLDYIASSVTACQSDSSE